MTATFWLSTGQTVVLLASCAWAWWATGRIAHLLNAAELIRAHSEAGAQRATRAALDARAMLDVLTEHWQRMRDQQDDPETQPYPVVGPETVPESRAIGLVEDQELAYELARLEQIMRGDRPAPKRRSRT